MLSRVVICKKCMRRVLDEQLQTELPDSCIYCLVAHLKQTELRYERRIQDFGFALEILDLSYQQVVEAYDAAIAELDNNSKEIHRLRDEIQTLQNGQSYNMSVRDLLG